MPNQIESNIIETVVANQRRLEKRRWLVLLAFCAFCIIGLILDIATGPSMLPINQVVKSLLGLEGADEMANVIVHDLRLPMALMALVVGAALAAGGSEIQTLLNNPMASPYTLGLAAASGFGASAVISFGTFGLPLAIAVPLGAFCMTMLASGILFFRLHPAQSTRNHSVEYAKKLPNRFSSPRCQRHPHHLPQCRPMPV